MSQALETIDVTTGRARQIIGKRCKTCYTSEMSPKKHILVVEDEKALSHALTLKLTNAGYDVTHIDNGEEALRVVMEEQFDLILLDILMPKMDGFSMLAELKENGKSRNQKIIVLSSLGSPQDMERAKTLGASEYLVKTHYPIATIVDKVNALLQ